MDLAPTLSIRWMIRRDMEQILPIEMASFSDPWTEHDFFRCLRQRNCIGMVAENGDDIAGFMVYELHKSRIELLNFAVKPALRGCGVGRAMIEKLFDKLSIERRNRIELRVSERNLNAQQFLRHLGFRAILIEPVHLLKPMRMRTCFCIAMFLSRKASMSSEPCFRLIPGWHDHIQVVESHSHEDGWHKTSRMWEIHNIDDVFVVIFVGTRKPERAFTSREELENWLVEKFGSHAE